MPEVKIAVILGSTRPGRNGKAVADWVVEKAASRTTAQYDLIDLADHPLPHVDEAAPPSIGQYAGEHTKAWAATIGAFDGFVFVTPEYNHSTSGVLKNAIDYLYGEWNNKAAAFVSYGSLGGARGDRAPARHRQRAADRPHPSAAELLAVHRLRELLDLRSRPAARRRRSRPLRPAGVVDAGDEHDPRPIVSGGETGGLVLGLDTFGDVSRGADGAPTPDEKRHHYPQRFWPALPELGGMTVFDRSWYQRLIVADRRR
ncbi:MAG TPA: NAD(P)H-dependent oxidoreductase, partial [Solirubrobacteraceae bacterium]|nr:NAD(P)H-dependent oxidoreductase [Solirubrobacteraceae bacterium]